MEQGKRMSHHFFTLQTPHVHVEACPQIGNQEMRRNLTKTRMKPKKIEFFRHMLTQKIKELHREAGRAVAEMKGDSKENYPDPNDRASFESDRNCELQIRDRERQLILKLKEAIQRIDNGVFGICNFCGGPITEKRLMARPVTTLCIDCKMKQEKMEKLTSRDSY